MALRIKAHRKEKALAFSVRLNIILAVSVATAILMTARRHSPCNCNLEVPLSVMATSQPFDTDAKGLSSGDADSEAFLATQQPQQLVKEISQKPCGPKAPSFGADGKADANEGWPTVLILSPCQNCVPWLGRHFRNIRRLQYPKNRISIAFLVGDSDDNNAMDRDRLTKKPPTQRYSSVQRIKNEFPDFPDAGEFRRIQIIHKDFVGGETVISREERHLWYFQKVRRSIMARSRNYLLQQALQDEDYVLWIDIDISEFGPGMLTRLISTGKNVVVPNVVTSYGTLSYDRNSWKRSLRLMETIDDEGHLTSEDWYEKEGIRSADLVCMPTWSAAASLQVEGYHDHITGNLPLSALHGNGDQSILEPVDGVGGGVLLVAGKLHREGLIFPTFPYRQRIETEGLAMMAIDMGSQPYGLPNYEVIH